MTLARTLWSVLGFLLVGALGAQPLFAENGTQGPGGDGGVVILPGATPITSDPSHLEGVDVTSTVIVTGVTAIRLQLPVEMVNAHAVMLVEGVEMPVRVVAQQVEIDAEIVETLSEMGIERADLLVVSSNSLAIRISILVNEGGDAGKGSNAIVRIH